MALFDRNKNRDETAGGRSGAPAATAVDDGPPMDDGVTRTRTRPARTEPGTARTGAGPVADAETMQVVRARQRDEYGGINWGAAFFGWLVAVGIAVLLTGILAAAGAAIGLTQPSTASAAQSQPDTLTLAGAIGLVIVLAIAYYCGGYVAGRMSRFDGARQGIGAWAIGLIITLLIAVVAVIFGDKYNVVQQANLPRLPVGSNTLTTGGLIATLVLLVVTLLAAAVGGKAGARYHRKIDRVGFAD